MVGGCGGAPSSPVSYDQRLDLGVPGALQEVREDVGYYPACGNEVLEVGGETWFPFTPRNLDDFPDPGTDANSAGALADGVVTDRAGDDRLPADGFTVTAAYEAFTPVGAVAPPGPDQDRGTLLVYEGGLAYWVADSDDLDTWLTSTPLEYNWVC